MLALMMVSFMAFGAEAVESATPTVAAIVFGCLLAVSEVLSQIKALNENSIFDIVKTLLKALGGMFIK